MCVYVKATCLFVLVQSPSVRFDIIVKIALINFFATGSTPVCGWRIEPADQHHCLCSIKDTFLNYEASASELLENLEEMFIRYYIDGDIINRF